MASPAPPKDQEGFTVVTRKRKGGGAEAPPPEAMGLRRVAKTKATGMGVEEVTGKVRRENPDLPIASVEVWSNGFIAIVLRETSGTEVILFGGKRFALLPFVGKPTKCSQCQRWGHH